MASLKSTESVESIESLSLPIGSIWKTSSLCTEVLPRLVPCAEV